MLDCVSHVGLGACWIRALQFQFHMCMCFYFCFVSTEPEDTKLEAIEPLTELYSVSLKQMSSLLTKMTSLGSADMDKSSSNGVHAH